MGFKFRKRVKLAPGVHLNLGAKSASVSVGPKGAKLNIGAKGARATVGIPGTGISYSQKLASGQTVSADAALSYSDYMRLSKEEKIAYRAAGGEVPAWAKMFKFLMWSNIILWGTVLLIAFLAKV